jgi:hypothetical protein
MTIQRRSTSEQLANLRRQEEALRARLSALALRKKSEDRKRETRRAFVVGAAALSQAQSDSAFREVLSRTLAIAVTKPGDRALITDLLPVHEETVTSSGREQSGTA